jgi:hypothetical protein
MKKLEPYLERVIVNINERLRNIFAFCSWEAMLLTICLLPTLMTLHHWNDDIRNDDIRNKTRRSNFDVDVLTNAYQKSFSVILLGHMWRWGYWNPRNWLTISHCQDFLF